MNDIQREFIQTVSEIKDAPLPQFPPDPGDLFAGLDTADGMKENREALARRNGCLGTHDPHLFKDEVNQVYYTSASSPGGGLRRSKDLIHWEYAGRALPMEAPEAAVKWCWYSEQFQAKSVWAPEVHVVNGKYRMYYSVSTFGHRLSYIGMAESDKPEGPYEDRGEIVKTTEQSPVNAIDANLITDADTGAQYMNFGSFWGGIRQIQLDPKTGLRLENNQPYYGRSLWKRHHRARRAIEGAYEIYNPDTGYYYLFTSYDFTRGDYNIRVARSRNPSGPFYDHMGRYVNNTCTGVDPDAIGLKIVDCHQFEDHFGWAATGHNGVLRDGDRYFISYHTHPTHNMDACAQHIRLMIFDREGWPLVSPCQYTGETRQKIDSSAVPGVYERIVLDKPDGENLCRQSHRMYLRADGQALIDGVMGFWQMDGADEILFHIGDQTERSFILASFDVDSGKPTLALTGRRSDGVCTWGKKRMEARV